MQSTGAVLGSLIDNRKKKALKKRGHNFMIETKSLMDYLVSKRDLYEQSSVLLIKASCWSYTGFGEAQILGTVGLSEPGVTQN